MTVIEAPRANETGEPQVNRFKVTRSENPLLESLQDRPTSLDDFRNTVNAVLQAQGVTDTQIDRPSFQSKRVSKNNYQDFSVVSIPYQDLDKNQIASLQRLLEMMTQSSVVNIMGQPQDKGFILVKSGNTEHPDGLYLSGTSQSRFTRNPKPKFGILEIHH